MPLLTQLTRNVAAGSPEPAFTGPFDWIYIKTVGAGILLVLNEGMAGQSDAVPVVAGDYFRANGLKRVVFKNPTGGALSVTFLVGDGEYRKMP